jgi:hypothetical protein
MDKKIIVIGNGSSVLDHELGDTINSFEEVVRFNDYKIDGYEKYVGSKTTIWARSNSKKTQERDWGQFKRVIVCSPEWNYSNIAQLIRKKVNGESVPKEQSLCLQNELGLPGRKRRADGTYQRGWPSTGLLALNYLLKEYKCIYIYGFDHFREIDCFPRHYYKNKEKMERTGVHMGHLEREWIQSRLTENKFKLLH